MSTILSEFGPYLRQLRHRKNLTLRQMAAQTAIPHTTLYQLESGALNPRLTDLAVLSESFGIRITTFLRPIAEFATNGSRPKRKRTSAPKKRRKKR